MPGFGKVVYEFIQPIFKSAKPDRLPYHQSLLPIAT